jgi:hypothetical protein
VALDQPDIDLITLARLAKAVAFISGTENLVTIALCKAVESKSARDIKNARLLFLQMKPGLRKAALAMIGD